MRHLFAKCTAGVEVIAKTKAREDMAFLAGCDNLVDRFRLPTNSPLTEADVLTQSRFSIEEKPQKG